MRCAVEPVTQRLPLGVAACPHSQKGRARRMQKVQFGEDLLDLVAFLWVLELILDHGSPAAPFVTET